MDDSSGIGWLLFCGGIPIAILVIRYAMASDRRKRMLQAQQKYNESLSELKADPTNADLKQKTLELGRIYARLAREGGKETIFDEMALSNDINAVTAHVTPVPTKQEPQQHDKNVEQRLSDLSNLLDKGLISKEEYARKRSEILADL
jgi:hypothetical protein